MLNVRWFKCFVVILHELWQALFFNKLGVRSCYYLFKIKSMIQQSLLFGPHLLLRVPWCPVKFFPRHSPAFEKKKHVYIFHFLPNISFISADSSLKYVDFFPKWWNLLFYIQNYQLKFIVFHNTMSTKFVQYFFLFYSQWPFTIELISGFENIK